VVAHRQKPVESVLPGVRLPAARLADGRVIVCGAFDSVYWTKDVDDGERGVRDSLRPDDDSTREIWFEGSVSTRARGVRAAWLAAVRERRCNGHSAGLA